MLRRSMTWTRARTLDDLGACTALWLRGELPHMPTSHYCESVSPETKRLIPILAELNLSGKFITTFSQPGCIPLRRGYGGIMERQRAAVMGFVPPDAIANTYKVLESLPNVDLKVSRPGSPSGRQTQLVSQNKGRDITWCGHVLSQEEIAEHYGPVPGWDDHPGLDPMVISSLQGSYQVSVVDLLWGRNHALWPALQQLT